MEKKAATLDEYAQNWMQDSEEVAAYLNEVLEEGDEALLLVALRRIAKNYDGGIRGLSNDLGMNRSSLNNALDENGNPTLKTMFKILDKLGYRVQLVPKPHDNHRV
ncbi:addiction module antidote protein [Saccharospirillum salsuginis]|uniref:Addiction module antidote protein n=1 Tax=Saccharospirillum salsuginis TaxID=418750 RepID=A0A918K334_9GAMM|nr:addiction module antidote protein [Saccharospirillum salsuginis]GGX42771.1 putative addiction module antidote protein [Saccharospirillum salsuginis]